MGFCSSLRYWSAPFSTLPHLCIPASTQILIQVAHELAQGAAVRGSPSQKSMFLRWLFFSFISSPSWLPTRSQEQQHTTTKRSIGWCKCRSPSALRQQMPQNHTRRVNENLAIRVSARAEAPCLLKEEFAWHSRRRQEHRLHTALDASS